MGNFSKEQQAKKKEQKAKRSGTYQKPKRIGTVKLSIIIALVISIPLAIWVISKLKMEGDRYFVESDTFVNEVDTTYIPDGIYYARYDSGSMSATVGVTVSEGEMTEIAIYDYENISTEKAEALFQDIIKYQMLNTPDAQRDYSELVLLKTVEAALTGLSTTAPTA